MIQTINMIEKKITATLIDRMERNEKISSMFLNNPDMRNYISDEIMKEVYWNFRQQSPLNISPNV